MSVKSTIDSEELSEGLPAQINRASLSSPSIVSFDNEIIKSWKSPAAFLHTFAAVGKSMSGASEARAERF